MTDENQKFEDYWCTEEAEETDASYECNLARPKSPPFV